MAVDGRIWPAGEALLDLVYGREAEDKYREYHEHTSIEGSLAHFSSSTGLDFSHYEADEPIRYVKNDAINSAVETLTTLSTEPWTLRRIVSRMGLGSRNPAIVGSAEEVAEDLISWVDETDIDASLGLPAPGRPTAEQEPVVLPPAKAKRAA